MSSIGLRSGGAARAPGANSIRQCRRRVLVLLIASAMMTPAGAKGSSTPDHRHVPPHRSGSSEAKHHTHGSAHESKRSERAVRSRILPERESGQEPGPAPQLSPDLTATRQAIELVRHHKFSEAAALAATIDDPIARKLVEWMLLRDPDSPAGFDRYAAFIQTNADWPSISLLRRRAEARLWQERRDAATVRRFLGGQPVSALGRLALARVLQGEGDRAGAEREVRAVWQSAEMSAELETAVSNEFPGALTSADDIARMDRRIGAKDFGAAMRAAKRLGPGRVAIVKACEAAEANSKKVEALLGEVPNELRGDLGYVLCRLHWLQVHDDVPAAAKLLTETSREGLERQDVDEWWRERRLLARRLIDLGDPQTAYRVVRDAAVPSNPYYRSEYHFMAGWIALRFLNDPADGARRTSPTLTRVRAIRSCWRAPPIGVAERPRRRASLMKCARSIRPPRPILLLITVSSLALDLVSVKLRYFLRRRWRTARASDLLHAADILYAIGEFDLVLSFVSDFAETSTDIATLDGARRTHRASPRCAGDAGSW